MASFTKRPNGSYQGIIYVGRDENGKQIRKTVTRPTLKECKAAVREIERALEDKNYSRMENVRLIAWIEEWLELNKNELAPSTYATYKLYLKVHYKPYFKNKKFKELNDIDIKQFIAHQFQKGLSANTIRKHVSVLNKMLEDALKDRNPARHVKLPSKIKFQPYVLSTREFEELHNAVKNTVDEIVILLAAWCGLRRGEIFALKRDDVFKSKGTIRVDESYTINEDYDYEYGPPKSDNGYREVAVPKYLMDLIQAHMKNQVQRYSKRKRATPERLFDFRPDYYSERFHRIIVDNKLAPIRFHDLRHYHASWLYRNNLPDHYAAQRLGHDIQTLKTIYQHLGLSETKQLDETVINTIEETTKPKRFKLARRMHK